MLDFKEPAMQIQCWYDYTQQFQITYCIIMQLFPDIIKTAEKIAKRGMDA
jgi:L-fucose isomerase-like protein